MRSIGERTVSMLMLVVSVRSRLRSAVLPTLDNLAYGTVGAYRVIGIVGWEKASIHASWTREARKN